MTPERLQEIRRVFESLIDGEAGERAAALSEAKDRDPELAKEVEALISAYDRRAGFIEHPITTLHAGGSAESRHADRSGAIVGPYRLLDLIGEGGMGEVWRAEQQAPVRRIVAVKLIKAGMDTREVVARFGTERQALALMSHPAIARVFDAGSTPEGRPYFVMEYVPGVPITRYCDQRRLTTRERLKLFVRACEGVQHAHHKSIIHRDLKPSNILVTELEGKPAPKIIDFGVSRAVLQNLDGETALTRTGAILGTLDYMSPEQASGKIEDIDTRTDVYSLGVVLFELLVGSRPFNFRGLGFEQILHTLRHVEAPRPSSAVREAGSSPEAAYRYRSEPQTLAAQLRGDLDAITLRALDKDPSRRYDSPADLAADIGRYLRNEPVTARPASISYRSWKYVRRNKAAVTVVSSMVLLLASFGIAEAVQLRRITRERDRADRVTKFMTSMFRVSDPGESRGNRITAREILDKASAEIGTGLARDPSLQQQMMDVMGTVYDNLGLYPQAESLFRRTFEIRRRMLGADHPETARALTSLANSINAQGRRSEASALFSQALQIRRRVLGPNHPQTLESMNDWATVLAQSTRFVEAEKLHRQLVEAREQLLGPEHTDTLNSMDSLGQVLNEEGRYREAESLLRRVLEIRRRVTGSDHPQTLRTIHHLANTLYYEGRYTETEKLDREVLTTRRRVLGPEHRDTLNAMIALGDTLDNEGRYADAEKLDREAVEIQRRVLGPEHPDTLLGVRNLAGILADQGQYLQAETMFRDVWKSRLKVLGPEHADTLSAQAQLASVLILKGRLDEAESLARQTREIQERALGPEHPDTAETTYYLACIAAQRGNHTEALLAVRRAVDHGLKLTLLRGLASDPRLKPLRADPQFAALSAYARERAAAMKAPQ